MALEHSLKYIEDFTGILPSVIAQRIFWDSINHDKLSIDDMAKLEDEFTTYATAKFHNGFNHSVEIRKSCARVQSIDDLSEIDKWFSHWFEGWNKRRIKNLS